MTELFENIRRAIESCPVDRLPRVLGQLREIESHCLARLNGVPAQPAPEDDLLTVQQAANRLHCSAAYLYKNSLPFKRKLGRKLLFSSAAISEYLQKQK